MDRSNDGFVVYSALLKAGFERKPKVSPVDYARRLTLEKLSLRRRYCDAFALWKSCAQPACRRPRSCRGDANACLKQGLPRVPHDVQWRVRQAILDATPPNMGAPERKARQSMPGDLYE